MYFVILFLAFAPMSSSAHQGALVVCMRNVGGLCVGDVDSVYDDVGSVEVNTEILKESEAD